MSSADPTHAYFLFEKITLALAKPKLASTLPYCLSQSFKERVFLPIEETIDAR